MKEIISLQENNITSKANSATEISSITELNVMSKTELDIQSNEARLEKEAFLYTAKKNASLMFAKYL